MLLHDINVGISVSSAFTGLCCGIYDISIHSRLSTEEVQTMLRILRTELIEPIERNHEDARVYSTLDRLQNMFGEVATVTVDANIERYGMDQFIHFIGSDTPVFIISTLERDVTIQEEGSVAHIEHLFHRARVM